MMFDALMHRGESLPHGAPATLFSRPADLHASLLFAIRFTLAIFPLLALSIPTPFVLTIPSPFALNLPSPFAPSVAERSRRVTFEALPSTSVLPTYAQGERRGSGRSGGT